MKKIKEFFGEIEYDKAFVMICLFIASIVAYYINPFDSVELSNWDRSFSPATMATISIGKRVMNVYLTYFVFFPVVMVVSYVITFFLVKDVKQKRFLRDYSFIHSFAIVSAYLSRFNLGDETYVSVNSLVNATVSFIIVLFVANLLHITDGYDYDDYIFTYVNHLFLLFSLTIPFEVSNDNILLVYLISSILSFADFCFLGKFIAIGKKKILIQFCECMYFMVIGWIVLVEAMYILAEKGFVTSHPFRVLIAYSGFSFVLSLAFSHCKKKEIRDTNYWGAVISVSMASLMEIKYKILYDVVGYANLFETGNTSISLESFEYSKMPIIDYFSAHALQDVFSSIMYWFLSGDARTAIFANPWQSLVKIVAILLLYYLVLQVFDKNWATLFIFVYPFITQTVFWGEIAFVAVIGVIGALRKSDKLSVYIAMWALMVISAVSRYDAGIAVVISSFIVIVVLISFNQLSLKKSAEGLLYVLGPIFILYIVYCRTTGVDFVNRIKEWLAVGVGSSSTWATVSFGNPSSFKFFLVYELFPLIDAIIIFITVLLMAIYKRSWEKGTIALILGLSYAFMITRTLVFHNLSVAQTGRTGVAINYFPLAVFFFLIYVFDILDDKKNHEIKMALPLLALGITLALATISIGERSGDENASVFGRGISSVRGYDVRKMQLDDAVGGSRTEFSEYTKSVYQPFESIFDVLLTDDQTFLDFANITGLYALTSRHCPSYVSQTPSLLTTEKSQEYYLNEIRANDVPIAVMGNKDMDFTLNMLGTRHNIRYYKVAEYIYENYVPLVLIRDEFAIWCIRENRDTYLSWLNEAELLGDWLIPIEPGYDENNHCYQLGDIPYIWANRDSRNARDNEVLCEAEKKDSYMEDNNRIEVFSFAMPEDASRQNGQYLCFEYTGSPEEDVASLVISQGNDFGYEYDFSVKPGENTYLLRVSCDYYWFSKNPNTIIFLTQDAEGTFENVRILDGD